MARSLFDLEGRVALVTGGNSGIGRALAMALREAGARVAIGSRRAARNAEVVKQLGGDSLAFALDVTDEASVEHTLNGVKDRFGRLDILVNNAGIVKRASVMEHTRVDWDDVIHTNVTGPFLCTKHAARLMKAQGSGKIINIASAYAHTAPSRGLQMSYTVSKHAIIGLTKVNAVELAPLGIQVNAISPGYFHTEITAELRGSPFEQAVKRRTPQGRWGETPDLVGACIYLSSAASDHVTGACIAVDGGYLATDGLERG